MNWRITRSEVSAFKKDLWKDERNYYASVNSGLVSRDDIFFKHCFTEENATVEKTCIEAILKFPLNERILCPEIEFAKGPILALEKISGVRLFELLRFLKILELRKQDGVAASVRAILFTKARERLGHIQTILLREKNNLAIHPYPMEEKLGNLLFLLSNTLNVSGYYDEAQPEIVKFSNYWNSECTQVPFRDATTKNSIAKKPELQPSAFQGESDRIAKLEALLETKPISYWKELEVIEIDFSSVEHLTSIEDDPISLHFHEWTDGSAPLSSDCLNLLQKYFSSSSYRSAATMLVRYLRFGGRKLAYSLFNSQAGQTRFRYDNSLFYFQTVREKCDALSKEFVNDFPALFQLLDQILRSASNPSPADLALIKIDQLRRFYPDATSVFWQENPSETK